MTASARAFTDALPTTLEYRPAGLTMWDAWCLVRGDEVHCFYLQNPAPGSTRPPAQQAWLGHAVSGDLIDWHEQALALPPNDAGTLDDLQPWTGCVVVHAGMYYLFFTMRSSRDGGNGQHIGVATSRDLETWTRHPGNPVISPDPTWYISHQHPLRRAGAPEPAPRPAVVDCRDLVTVVDPSGDGWFGFYAARVWAEEAAEQAVIATVHSRDLIHWRHLPPAFAPGRYHCLEVPDVFLLNGRWYLTCLTGNHYGNRGIFSDPYVCRGTIYAVADQPQGPYRELPDDQTLLGGADASCGYSCRTLVFHGQRLALMTMPCPHDGGVATLSPPFTLHTLATGALRLGYSDLSHGWRRARLVGAIMPPVLQPLPSSHPQWDAPAGRWQLRDGGYHGASRSGWQIAWLPLDAADLEVEACVVIEQGVAAGLAFTDQEGGVTATTDLVVALDAQAGCVLAGRVPDFEELHRRRMTIRLGCAYQLHVCLRRSRVEVYVNGCLMLQFALRQPMPRGQRRVGLFVDRGQCRISALDAYALGPVARQSGPDPGSTAGSHG